MRGARSGWHGNAPVYAEVVLAMRHASAIAERHALTVEKTASDRDGNLERTRDFGIIPLRYELCGAGDLDGDGIEWTFYLPQPGPKWQLGTIGDAQWFDEVEAWWYDPVTGSNA